ncbi:hepatoma-derived growth factor-related protein 3 [Drosophila pseudoobscura]|uniref:Hepatoma-derived growth factor-related protein 3 n=1 Tax=Drosophila pseudoobscura pseudoobscura TaxID=46245 RepID=A0A6I8V6Y0_DROPS|nr:hepatoma-derived growth factor-related protein 3 [Drosophila pseudoobscura]
MGTRKKAPFTAGQFVFGKVRGFRAWPGRLINELGSAYNVYFYGTCDYAKVPKNKIFDFAKTCKRYGKVHDRNSKVCRSFQEAMSQIQKAVSQPSLDFGYFTMVAHLEQNCGESDSDSDSDSGTLDLSGAELKGKLVPFRHIVADSDTDTEMSSEPKKTPNSQ